MGKKPNASLVSALVLASCFFSPLGLRADTTEESEPDEPSLVDQPSNVLFSGAVGTSFKVTAGAAPTRLQAEDPLVLTLRVTATGPWQKPPRRLDLRKLPRPFARLTRQFEIERVKKDQPDREPAQGVWEFDYRLRPHGADVTELPSLPFTYYNPRVPFQARRWQTAYTAPVPLTVTPRAAVQPAEIEASSKPRQLPDRLYKLAAGKGVLRLDQPFALLGWFVMTMLFLTIPGACAGWYVIRRRFYPDAGRLSRRQRSRAARQALKALRAAPAVDVEVRARIAALVVTRYLQQRFELRTFAPAPFEVAAHLAQCKLSPDLTSAVAEFLRFCDAEQFAPKHAPTPDGFRDTAQKLILALEYAGGTPENGAPPDGAATFRPRNAAAVASPTTRDAKRLTLLVGLCSLGVACSVSIGRAETPSDDQLLAQAEAAFEKGVAARGTANEEAYFAEAAVRYEELRRRGAANAMLYRNEGNAYLLAGDLPRAILAYRRGLALDPNDRDLRANLAYARDRVAFPVAGTFGRPESDPLPPWLPRPGAAACFASMFVCYALGWIGLTRWRMTRTSAFLGIGLLAFAASVLCGLGLSVDRHQIQQEREHPLLVVAHDGVFLHKGNGLSYPHSYDTPLNRGVEARLLFARDTWLQIELAGGEVGWVPHQAVVLDAP